MGMVVSSTGDGSGMARCCREVVRSLELACAISRTRRRRLRRATRGQSAMRCGTPGVQLLLQFMACVRWRGVRAPPAAKRVRLHPADKRAASDPGRWAGRGGMSCTLLCVAPEVQSSPLLSGRAGGRAGAVRSTRGGAPCRRARRASLLLVIEHAGRVGRGANSRGRPRRPRRQGWGVKTMARPQSFHLVRVPCRRRRTPSRQKSYPPGGSAAEQLG